MDSFLRSSSSARRRSMARAMWPPTGIEEFEGRGYRRRFRSGSVLNDSDADGSSGRF